MNWMLAGKIFPCSRTMCLNFRTELVKKRVGVVVAFENWRWRITPWPPFIHYPIFGNPDLSMDHLSFLVGLIVKINYYVEYLLHVTHYPIMSVGYCSTVLKAIKGSSFLAFFFFWWIRKRGQSPNNSTSGTTRTLVTPEVINTLDHQVNTWVQSFLAFCCTIWSDYVSKSMIFPAHNNLLLGILTRLCSN